MTQAEHEVSLPTLQHRLDALEVGEQLTIPREMSNHLFGPNEIGEGRLANFAAGHGCISEVREESVTFYKSSRRKP